MKHLKGQLRKAILKNECIDLQLKHDCSGLAQSGTAWSASQRLSDKGRCAGLLFLGGITQDLYLCVCSSVFMWCVNVSRADLWDALVNAILGFSLAPSKWVLLQARIPSAFDWSVWYIWYVWLWSCAGRLLDPPQRLRVARNGLQCQVCFLELWTLAMNWEM